MMRKFCLSVLTLALVAPVMLGESVDDIIAKNVQARGGMDKIKAVKSVRMTGKMTMGPMEAPITLVKKRPDQIRMEFTIQGMTGIQAYDGKSGWSVMPFMGKKDPETMTADDLKEIEEQADMDGPLVDYKAKGHAVELLGKEKIEGTDAYKLKVTLKNGDISTVYLDADNFLEIKTEGKRTVRGSEQEVETAIGDYKEVDGLMIPFGIEQGPKGSPQKQKFSVEKVEFNVPADDASFKQPPPAPVAPAEKPADKSADKPKEDTVKK